MKRILLPAGGAVLATGLLAAGLAGTAQAAPDWAYDTMAKSAPDAQLVANFWTARNGEALKNATPYSWDVKNTPTMKVAGGYTPDGKPGSVVPIGEEKKSASVVKNINLPKTIGKVFFLDEDDKPRWCSATSIQAKYRNLVATAGHCVYDDGKDSSVADRWVFVPGYYQGKTPWGIYVGKTAYTHYDFAAFEDRDRDYAFVTVYNGVQVGGASWKPVTKAEWDKHTGDKDVKGQPISKAQFDDCTLNLTGDCYSV
ncbi:trypsin-like serine peptidase, partial [Planomonospora parontospora]|uniref:trypsin-like serine peptidase n=2 Tax=Planomonospora parontospora TaxID=58119 RepID=UPI003570F20A